MPHKIPYRRRSALRLENRENRKLLAIDSYIFEGIIDQAVFDATEFTSVGGPVVGRLSVDASDPKIIHSFELSFGDNEASSTQFLCEDLDVDFGSDEVFITSDCVGLRDVYLSLGWNGTDFTAGNGYVGQETEIDGPDNCDPNIGCTEITFFDGDITSVEKLNLNNIHAELLTIDANEFGPYLPGVSLEETFELRLPQAMVPFVEKVEARINSETESETIPRAPGRSVWPFKIDVGELESDSSLALSVYWNDGQHQNLEGTIDIDEDGFNVELSVKPSGQSGTGVDIKDIRLIAQIPLERSVEITPKVTGLSDTQTEVYADRIDLFIVDESGRETVLYEEFLGDSSLNTNLDAFQLEIGTHRIVAKAADEANRRYRVEDIDLSDDNSLLVVDLPNWLEAYKTEAKFEVGGELGEAFGDANASGYSIKLSVPGGEEGFSPGGISPKGFVKDFAESFADLNNQIEFGLELSAYAMLTHTAEGIVQLDNWRYGVTLLGETLVEPQSGKFETQGIEGSLDGKDLALNGLNISQSLDLKQLLGLSNANFSVAFGGEAPIPIPVPGLGVTAKLQGAFDVDLKSLQANVDIMLRTDDGELDFGTSQIVVNATASSSLKLEAGVGVGISVLPEVFDTIPIATALVRGTVSLDFAGSLPISISGRVRNPDIGFENPTARVSLGYDVDWDICLFSDDCEPDQEPLQTRDKNIAFYGEPSPYSLTSDATLTGDGVKSSDGLPGVTPQGRNGMAILGRVPTSQAGIRSLLQVSELVLPEGMHNVRAVEFERNLLSDTKTVKPKQHYLEVLAISPNQVVELAQLDLADIVVESNENPFGFASGWERVRVELDSGSLPRDQDFALGFRLLADDESLANVGVALDQIELEPVAGRFLVNATEDFLDDEIIDFATEGGDNQTVRLSVINDGDGILVIDAMEVSDGYEITSPWQAGLGLARGQSIDVLLKATRELGPDTGVFRIAAEDPGVAPVEIGLRKSFVQLEGDFDLDGVRSSVDLDLLSAAIAAADDVDLRFDLNHDDEVDSLDLRYWVEELAETFFGDTNLDGRVDFSDFLALSAGFGQEGGWESGDLDASGSVDFADFLLLSQNFGRDSKKLAGEQ